MNLTEISVPLSNELDSWEQRSGQKYSILFYLSLVCSRPVLSSVTLDVGSLVVVTFPFLRYNLPSADSLLSNYSNFIPASPLHLFSVSQVRCSLCVHELNWSSNLVSCSLSSLCSHWDAFLGFIKMFWG